MKRNDLIIIGIVAFIAAIFSIILSDLLFSSPKKNPVKVPDVTAISSNFPDVKNEQAYKQIFNSNALDPTQLIQIGNTNNQAPFQSGNNQ